MAPASDPLTPIDAIAGIVDGARRAFASGRTRPLEWRISTLHALRAGVIEHERALEAALADDLGKPALETFAAEIGFTLGEIDHALANLPGWMAPRKVPTPLTLKPGSSRIVPEPLGVVARHRAVELPGAAHPRRRWWRPSPPATPWSRSRAS